ncbi:MAG: hypothetical protein GY814_12615 [Gammaproteobacteria bacterium]|nr:hypothetical protein [Gammaproteobacteria bacterium]
MKSATISCSFTALLATSLLVEDTCFMPLHLNTVSQAHIASFLAMEAVNSVNMTNIHDFAARRIKAGQTVRSDALPANSGLAVHVDLEAVAPIFSDL